MDHDLDDFIPTRRSLLSRLKDWNDQERWQDFFDTYWKLIYGAAIKSGLSDVEAQEVVQETVITVTKKIKEFKTDPAFGSFKAWLLHLTRWRIADQLRKRRHPSGANWRRTDKSSTTSTVEKIPDPAGFELESIWDEEWKKNLIDAALERVKRQVNAKQYQMASGRLEEMCVIPPRNPVASPRMIDLTPYYTSSKRGYNSLAALPSGLRTIASTSFDIRGVIELSRLQDRGVEGGYPEKITGIKIGLKSRRLHFLQATNLETKDGTRVGDYVVHYANHETQVIPIVYGKDVRNWWTVTGEPFNTQNSTLVWIGSNPVVAG